MICLLSGEVLSITGRSNVTLFNRSVHSLQLKICKAIVVFQDDQLINSMKTLQNAQIAHFNDSHLKAICKPFVFSLGQQFFFSVNLQSLNTNTSSIFQVMLGYNKKCLRPHEIIKQSIYISFEAITKNKSTYFNLKTLVQSLP